MPTNEIKAHVEALLKVELNSKDSYGKGVDDPAEGLVIRVTDTAGSDSASPNALKEIQSNMEEVYTSARNLAGSEAKKAAIDSLYRDTLMRLPDEGAVADLFGKKGSDTNEIFKKQFKELKPVLANFIEVAAKISGVKVKDLDAEGHKRRSEEPKATIVHEFQTEKQKDAGTGESHFIIYEAAGRLTAHQMAMKKIQGEKINSAEHATTSHHKKGLVEGSSNFMRMIVGTKDAKGKVTIVNDSFSGPGARMPYKDLKGADKYKKMAVKAITFSNQEEIVQALAQRVYDQHLVGKSQEDIQAYFKENPLIETYTQVISPAQANYPGADKSDANRAQFEFVRDAIRAFDGGSGLTLNIDTKEGEVLDITANYQGRHGCFGVNAFKSSNDSIAKSQNARYMNQITDDTLKSLEGKEIPQELKDLLGNQGNISEDSELTTAKTEYRAAMQKYDGAYQQYTVDKKNNKKTDKGPIEEAYKDVEKLESQIAKLEANVDMQHKELNGKRGGDFNKGKANAALAAFKTRVSNKIMLLQESESQLPDALRVMEGPNGLVPSHKLISIQSEIKELQSTYNKCAYLVEAKSLYHDGSWAKVKNTFKLQALTGALGTELGHGNTKGCKSNNDRGQRLAQKIASLSLAVSNNPGGLYDSDCLNKPHESLNKPLTTIQMIAHRLNTGVGGGKFGLKSIFNFADNGMQGKMAKLAKLEDVTKKGLFGDKPLKDYLNKKALLVLAAAVAVTAVVLTGGLALPAVIAVAGVASMSVGSVAAVAVSGSTAIGLGAMAMQGKQVYDVSSEHDKSIKAQVTGYLAKATEANATETKATEANATETNTTEANATKETPSANTTEYTANPALGLEKTRVSLKRPCEQILAFKDALDVLAGAQPAMAVSSKPTTTLLNAKQGVLDTIEEDENDNSHASTPGMT